MGWGDLLKKRFLMLLTLCCLGCSDDPNWFALTGRFGDAFSRSTTSTIDVSEFKNGRLRIGGSCSDEGDVMLVLPSTKGDTRIIGSPKCANGRYEVVTSQFGRPPCEVTVDYSGGHLEAKVHGADIYCD